MVWNKGLTKETDGRVRKATDSIREGYKTWRIGWNKGKRLSKEHKDKISESEMGKYVSPETRKKISDIQRGRSYEERMGFVAAQAQRELKRLQAINRCKNGGFGNKEKKIESYKKYRSRPEIKKKYSDLAKKRFMNEDFIARWTSSLARKPNGAERKLIQLIKKEHLPYQYVGDFSFWVGGKNPDFLNINGQKKLIELYGNYWHNLEGRMSEKERKCHFKRYGFDCLIVWERELADEVALISKLKEFEFGGVECL
jgi:G:T-mismatch repair DNA endonuclease (very short patch repair protein)